MTTPDLIVFGILLAGMIFSIGRKKLTVPAALTGAILGWLVYKGGGYTGLALLTSFFVLGTAATSWQKKQKALIEGHASHQPTRTAGQVIANGGVAAITGLAALLFPRYGSLLQVMMAASLASAAADTLSSELGMVYGRRYYHILTWQPDEKGLDGVVSREGWLIGMAASAVIAIVYTLGHGWDTPIFLVLVLSGTLGNLLDSVLGAVWERKGQLSNNAVNFLNTLAAALICALFVLFCHLIPIN
jgi:uncharacterized protein (TIGR00297 family)